MTVVAGASHPRTGGEILALQLLAAIFLAMRIWYQFAGGVLSDEAYYWMWGQHPAWSYFDHPPLHAWLLGLISFIGWHPFSVRLLTWASLALVLAIFWHWSARLAPANPRLWFWRATALYLASPLFFVLTSAAYNDHLLVALCLAATHCFGIFVERAEAGQDRAKRWLYTAALVLGLAALTKYNAVFLGLGFALTFLIRPKLRPLLLTPAPWLAALLALATQLPVLWWNLSEAGASFRYHFDDRWAGDRGGLDWSGALVFLITSLLFWSPFLLWPLIRLVRTPAGTPFESVLRTPALATFVVSTLILTATSLVLGAYSYWNIVALTALTPLLVAVSSSWLRIVHYVYGLLIALLMMVNFSIMPVATILNARDFGTAINYDWHILAERIEAAQAQHPDALLAATRYSTTSQLGFALGTTEVVKLSPEHSQWDFWQESRDFSGQSALILADESDRSGVVKFLRARFETLEAIDSITIERFGKPIYRWRILLGTNWRPPTD